VAGAALIVVAMSLLPPASAAVAARPATTFSSHATSGLAVRAPGGPAPKAPRPAGHDTGNVSFSGPPLPLLAGFGILAVLLGRGLRVAIRPHGGRP
jgi:hypothetical protein